MNEEKTITASTECELGAIPVNRMIDRLLFYGVQLEQIGQLTAIPIDKIQFLAGEFTMSDPNDIDHRRLFVLYAKNRVKAILRTNPFIGPKRAAATIGIKEQSYRDAYDALIGSGEVTFVLERPDWATGEGEGPLRKHFVK